VNRAPGNGGNPTKGDGGWGSLLPSNTQFTRGGQGITGIVGKTAGGGGGGGGATATRGFGTAGGGGGSGWIAWQYDIANSPSAGGGGGGAQPGQIGNGGQDNGTGGLSVVDNSLNGPGAGGCVIAGGAAGGSTAAAPDSPNIPGGGGAGGMFDIGDGAYTSQNGTPGQVQFSWNGGAVSPVAGNIVRFLMDLDAVGETNGVELVRISTYGTVANLSLFYHTGGHLQMIGKTAGAVTVFDSGSIAFGADGLSMCVSMELIATATGFTWKLTGIVPGAGSV